LAEIFGRWKLFQSGALCCSVLREFPELLLISNVKLTEKYVAFEPRLGLNASSTHRVSSRRDAKIKKFDTKTKFKKQKNMLPKGRNLRSIEWYQKL
jgi:hypothetical protein